MTKEVQKIREEVERRYKAIMLLPTDSDERIEAVNGAKADGVDYKTTIFEDFCKAIED